MKQVRVYVTGDVLGVGFRAWTKIQAKIIGVNGWVRNVHDRPEVFGDRGGVEALLQADEQALHQMIAKLRLGSPVSRVDDIEVHFEDQKEIFETFEIKK